MTIVCWSFQPIEDIWTQATRPTLDTTKVLKYYSATSRLEIREALQTKLFVCLEMYLIVQLAGVRCE